MKRSNSYHNDKLECVRDAFARVDKDGSGTIDISELERLLSQAGVYPSPAELDILYKRMDRDLDGEISFDEFYAAIVDDFAEQELEEEFTEIRELFSLVDKDGSQRLTQEELKMFIRLLGVSIKTPEMEASVVTRLYNRMKGAAATNITTDQDGVSIDEFASFLLKVDD
jgi:Ca2+-binding EF-hand superfamily protein